MTNRKIKKNKSVERFLEEKDKKEIAKQKMIEKIQKETKAQLLPTLKEKTKELTNYIVELLQNEGAENINTTIINSLIAKRSLLEIANAGNITYTPHEIMIGFNLYLEMIIEINKIKKFPPTVETFASFMGISRTTYNNWLVDIEKKEVMDYIHSYLLGTLATGGLTGEVKEISAMYQQKVMGKVEQTTPITIKHEKTADVEDIQKQLQALKKEKVIEAEWEENN